MINGLLATLLTSLCFAQNVRSTSPLATLNGFYKIEYNTSMLISGHVYHFDLNLMDDFDIVFFNNDDYSFKASADSSVDYTSASLVYTMGAGYDVFYISLDNDGREENFNITTSISVGSYYTDSVMYIQNVRYDTSYNDYFNFVPVSETGGNIINKVFDMSKFNPSGFLDKTYSENPFISNSVSTPVDLLGNKIVYYKGHRLTKLKSYWIDATGMSYVQNSSTYTIGDDDLLYYLNTLAYWYVDGTETNEIISASVSVNRFSNGAWVGTSLTSDLNNSTYDLYVVGSETAISNNDALIKSFSRYDTSVGNTEIGGNVGDVFTLLGTAFTGLGGFLSISIIPGITIGMLVCLPLVVGLILWLIKLFKKG